MTAPRRVPPRVVPTELAALALGVPPATIRKWASRGKLTRYGRPGRAEYDLDELFALAQARTGTGRGAGLAEPEGSAAESA
ncbi:transcriptional regulator [Streptomyces sp. NPDC020983]|uniref:transcriptional regulator n=1 Tax=Streptomyces sp. NPDC020983 TaxID=3365106 RepID=UPI0037B5D639